MSDQQYFKALREDQKTWAVAAIHGEAKHLSALHKKLEPQFKAGDSLVYLGNYMGYGPRVLDTINELLSFRRSILMHSYGAQSTVVYLRGYQEEMFQKLLQIQFAPDPAPVLNWMLKNGIASTLSAYGGFSAEGLAAAEQGNVALARWTAAIQGQLRQAHGHTTFLDQLSWAAYHKNGPLLLVSAGVDVTRPLSMQGDTFWWGGRNFDKINAPYGPFSRIVRGLNFAKEGAKVGNYATTLDDRCGFGGDLIAACFDMNGGLTEMISV
jgi:serine/threonine protein phosphatase 1